MPSATAEFITLKYFGDEPFWSLEVKSGKIALGTNLVIALWDGVFDDMAGNSYQYEVMYSTLA